MDFLYVKALHIIFVISWFAGLLYIVRLFIYHVEAENRPENEKKVLQEQYKIMEKKLWYVITWPACILTFIFGFWLAFSLYGTQFSDWLWLKLAFVFGLFLYHLKCGQILRQLQNNEIRYTSFQLRIWNEVATLFLVSIVFIVVLKSTLSFIWGLVGLVVFAAILMLVIRIYKRVREKS